MKSSCSAASARSKAQFVPSLDDIVGIAESLQVQPLLVDRERCIAVRHRQATCRRCAAACPMDAISVAPREITLHPSLCVACGACVVACPTEALIIPRAVEEDMLDALTMQASECAVATIACARACSKKRIDPARVAEVPCLARVDECMLVQSAAAGAHTVRLVDGDCATCKYGICMDNVVATIDSAVDLIEAQGAHLEIEYASELPADCLAVEDEALSASRRGFFSEAVSAARGASASVARATIGRDQSDTTTYDSAVYGTRVSEENGMPTFNMPRREALLNALFELGEPAQYNVESPTFAHVDIVADVCNGCGVCCVFCPTDALRRDTSHKPYINPRFLEFHASDCVNCGLCANVCWKKACKLSDGAPLTQILDFEPVAFRLDSGKSTNPAV